MAFNIIPDVDSRDSLCRVRACSPPKGDEGGGGRGRETTCMGISPTLLLERILSLSLSLSEVSELIPSKRLGNLFPAQQLYVY